MNDLVIWTKDLTKKFGDFVSVDKVSIEVHRSEIYGFIGSNGAGKTTTIRMLCGILDPTSGEGRVAGLDIFTEQEKIKSRIGYMSQRFSLYGDLTVDENIDFFCGVYKLSNQKRKIAKERSYEISQLNEVKNILTRDLPVGWKQRLALACALLHEPEIVFLDEPTAGVDPISRREFWDLIYELSSEGITVFVTTHFLDEAEHCTKIGLINAGKIVAQDSPSKLKKLFAYDVYEITTDDYITLFEVMKKKNLGQHLSIFGNTIHYVSEKGTNISEEIYRVAEEYSVNIHSIAKIHPSLEDVFINFIDESGITEQ